MKKISRLYLGIVVFFIIIIAFSCSDESSTKPIQVSPPVFSHHTGTYYSFIQVTISCETSESIIRYTNDGSEPTETSQLYTAPITVEKVTTIKAMAFKQNDSPSEIVSANYNLVLPLVSALEFTPSAGSHNFSKNVEINCATSDAQIYYTLDESEPTQMAELYDSPINITNSTTLKAKAFKSNHYPSQTLVGEYIINYPAPINPNPVDNASNISLTPILSWETLTKKDRNLSFDLYIGTSNNPVLVSEHQTENTYQTADLNMGTTYHWKVVTHDGEIETESPVWSFSTAVPLNPSPGNNASGVTINPTLTWEPAINSISKNRNYTYNVYFGTNSNPTIVSENQTEQLYTPTQLVEGTSYFWKIVVNVDDLQVECPTWQFTTNHAPQVPVNVFPENNAVDVNLHPTLRWLSTDTRNFQSRNLSFDVYFGTSTNPELVSDNQVTHAYRPNNIIEETTYYWKVVASDGEIEVESPVWSFTTGNAPTEPINPYPFNNQSNVVPGLIELTWDCASRDGVTYDVYFGTSQNLIQIATNHVTQELNVKVEENTTNWWKVVATDGITEVESSLWSFSTLGTTPENFVFVEGGTFNNGVANITLSDFYISKYEETQGRYQAIIGSLPPLEYGFGYDNPIYNVSWFSVIKYANKRSLQEGLTPSYTYGNLGANPDNWPNSFPVYWYSDANLVNLNCDFNANGYRLPTEMEWMYAAKGGNLTPATDYNLWSGTNEELQLPNYAWIESNNYPEGTKPVGTKLPNQLGIYDMSGNVWEWCWDVYADYVPGPQTDPVGPGIAPSQTMRVIRGGSCDYPAYYSLVWIRFHYHFPSMSDENLGFRLVRGLE